MIKNILKPSLSNNFYAILFILAACLTMTISAVLIKYIGKSFSTWEILLVRCSFTLFFIFIMNYRLGLSVFKAPRPFFLGLRSIFLILTVVGNFYAIIHLPLVQVTTLQFTKPLFILVLAAIFLGEKVRMLRTTATILGFIGVLIVLRPSGDFQIAQLAVLISALSMAISAIMVKKLLKDHHPITLILYGNILCIMIFLPLSIPDWKPLDLETLTLIAALGFSAFCGQFFILHAYKRSEVTVVTPFEYIRIIFVALAGYMIFGEIPDNWTIVGGTVICVSTLFIVLREAYKKKQVVADQKQ